jgi:uncharacterized protein YukE
MKGVIWMRKGIIAGVGVVMLLGGSFYGIKSVSAAENQPKVEAKAEAGTTGHVGKRLEVLGQYKDQIHQVNTLREERLDLRKQMVDKKDQLLDLLLAAKNSGNKAEFKQAKEVKKQVKSLNGELKTLLKEGQVDKKALKEAVKKGEASEQFAKRLATNQQINEKMKEKLAELDKMIEILK